MKVPVPCNSFDNLLCPLLQKLVLKYLVRRAHLKFSSPYLRELEIDGPFDEVYFENTPHLAVFSITKSGQFKTMMRWIHTI